MIVFAHNPTGWDASTRRAVPGGMSDLHIAPVSSHLLPGTWVESNRPQSGDVVNVYYTHRRTYHVTGEPGRVSVFAGHGIADKAWRDARKVKGFDFVCTSGPAWSNRLVMGGMAPTRLLEVGYPKLDPIFAGEVESPWPERDGRVRVLWAPTHGGGGERGRRATEAPDVAGARRTSHWCRDELLGLLDPDRFHVVEALHPRHRADGKSTLAEYVGADVVIADGGSTIYEAWALGLPVVFPSWATAAGHVQRSTPTFESYIYAHRVGRHAGTPDQLVPLVEQAAADGITEPEAMFVEPILPTALRGYGGQLFADALTRIDAGYQPTHAERVRFRHVDGRTVDVSTLSPRAQRYRLSDRWKVIE